MQGFECKAQVGRTGEARSLLGRFAVARGERTAREVSRIGYSDQMAPSQYLNLLPDLVHLCAWDAYEHLREGADGVPVGLGQTRRRGTAR